MSTSCHTMGWNQVPNWVGGVIVHPRGVILQTSIVHWSFVPLLRSITEAPCVPLFGGFLNVSFRIFDEIFVYTTQQQPNNKNRVRTTQKSGQQHCATTTTTTNRNVHMEQLFMYNVPLMIFHLGPFTQVKPRRPSCTNKR